MKTILLTSLAAITILSLSACADHDRDHGVTTSTTTETHEVHEVTPATTTTETVHTVQ